MADLEVAGSVIRMLPFNTDALRVRLTADFKALSNGSKNASQIALVLATLTQDVSCILRDLVRQWSQDYTVLRCIPDEILALCFTFLPLRDRITASHVSQAWRAVALANPVVWANLDFSPPFRNPHSLLCMALERTGTHPVCIRGSSLAREPDSERIVVQCLLEHMHHIKRIQSALPAHSLPLTRPAPVLDTISSVKYHIDIPNDFLGGQPQRLRCLHMSTLSLPLFCPALSTVKWLTLSGPRILAHAVTFTRLFELCPRLVRLKLDGLRGRFSNLLPSLTAPRSLRCLELSTRDADYDLMQHFIAWRSDALAAASLDQETATLPHLRQFIGTPSGLHVSSDPGLGHTSLGVHGPIPGYVRSVSFRDDAEDASCVVDMLAAAAPDLRDVCEVELPLAALHKFLPRLGALPALRRITVFVYMHSDEDPIEEPRRHWFPPDMFDSLLNAQTVCGGVDELEVRVVCFDDDCPRLTSEDASQLLMRLEGVGKIRESRISIKGFPADIIGGIDVSCVAPSSVCFIPT